VLKLLMSVLLAFGLIFVSVSAVEPPPANTAPAPSRYVERQCVIKAMAGKGMAGNGCNVYGVARWVDTSKRPIPNWVRNAVIACIAGGVVALVSIWFPPVSMSTVVVLGASCIVPAVAQQLTR
jgi:hypothetical protein